jgi:hypothetical protein
VREVEEENHMSLTDVHATQLYALGTRVRERGTGNEYIYLKGITSTAVGSVVVFDEAHVTKLADEDDKGRVAVAVSAVDANTKFGWYGIYGKFAAKVLAAFADNGAVFLTTTDGSVDDADVAGDSVHGMWGRSAIDTPSTGLAYMELNYPWVSDIAHD